MKAELIFDGIDTKSLTNKPGKVIPVDSEPSIKIDLIGRTHQLCKVCRNYYLTEKYSRCPLDEVEFGATE